VDIEASRAWGSTRTDQVDILTTQTSGYSKPSYFDVVDHDYDEVWFIAQPLIELSYTPASSYGPESLSWRFSPNQPLSAVIYWSYVKWLRDPTQMPATVKTFLDGHGITAAMYGEFLKADPFAYGYAFGQYVDPARFEYVTQKSLIPVPFPGAKPSSTTYSLTRSVNNSSNTTNEVTYSAKVTASTGLIFTKTSISEQFAWTSSTSAKIALGTNEGESVSLSQPLFGYNGPTITRIYVDKIYKTFFFSQDWQ